MPTEHRRWLTWRKALCVTLLLLTALYISQRERLESWLGVELPALVEREAADSIESAAKSPGPTDSGTTDPPVGGTEFRLKPIDSRLLESPAGLRYVQSPGENRIEHVMRHAQDDPSRAVHGVFSGNQDAILRMLDEAYRLFLQKSARVQSSRSGARIELSVDMQRPIGYVGGKRGEQRKHPESRRLRLILEGKNVITAYPY